MVATAERRRRTATRIWWMPSDTPASAASSLRRNNLRPPRPIFRKLSSTVMSGLRSKGKGVQSLRFSGRAFQKSAATLWPAARLDAQQRTFEKPQPSSVERGWIALLELQLDLVDRFCVFTFGGSDLTLV